MNFFVAVLIGLAVGLAGGLALRRKQANAVWIGPALSVAGALLASVLASLVGTPGYGGKEFGLQVVLAIVGVGALAVLTMRRAGPPPSSTTTASTTTAE